MVPGMFIIITKRRGIETISDGSKLIDTMNEIELKRVYIYPTYTRDSKIHSDDGFVNIDNGSMGGTHLTCFLVKDNKSF